MTRKSKGQIAYEAYSKAYWAPGWFLPWDDLSKLRQQAFEAAAEAVLKSEQPKKK